MALHRDGRWRLRPPDPAARHHHRHRPRHRGSAQLPGHRRQARQGHLPALRGPPRLGLPALRRDLPRRHLPAHPRRARRRQRHPRIGRHPPVRVRHLHRSLLRPRAHPGHHPGGKVARCRPRRKASFCPHGRRLSCGQRHNEDDACLGRPLCPDCYDYNASVVWNTHAPELWRRTVIGIRRRLDKLARPHGARVRLSFAKVAEFQRRGLIHFHAIFRLDGTDPVHPERTIPPPPAITADVMASVISSAAATTWFATVAHPAKPKGWDITWGAQVDPRVVRLTDDGQITDTAVASYLAKYATKSTEPVGVPPGKITPENARDYASPRTHQGRLSAACLKLGNHPHQDFKALRRWAHMLGYRGHFATKSRRYSTTMRALRNARRDWRRRQTPLACHHGDKTVISRTSLEWAGRGWRTSGDALLALSAAARAREHRRIAREEIVWPSRPERSSSP